MNSIESEISKSLDFYDNNRALCYADRLIEYINNCCDLEGIQVLSFDVFDTLLLRNDKYELERYLEMSQQFHDYLLSQGIERFSLWDVYAARLTAFKTCYRTVKPNCTVREGRLIDVLNLIAKILELDLKVVDRLLEIEINYETANLRTNPAIDSFLKHPKIIDKKIIFVSDMYLSGEQIQLLVKKYYPKIDLFKTYSSADIGLTKSSALLYERIIHDLGINRKAILHFGDNFHADVYQAKKSGLQAIHLPIPEYELEKRAQKKRDFLKSLEEKSFTLSLIY
jgi:predicted HAD superfamily hydrolase